MRKFAIKITKGNNVKIISTHKTKDEAISAGEKVNVESKKNDGTVSCICADFDEDDNMIGNKYWLYKSWI